MKFPANIHRPFAALSLAAALSFPAVPLLAAAPAVPPASSLPPAVQDALKDFTSEDFKTRNAASAKLQLVLAQQLQSLINSDDPEVLSRLDEILHDNDGLTRWIIDTLKLPPDQRKARLEFGLKPEVIPALALTYSSEPQKRVEGIKALAKIDDPQVAALLTKFLDDPQRRVYLAAMEAFWDKKPTDAAVDSLWNRALEELTPSAEKPVGPEANVTFRDQPLPDLITVAGTSFQIKQQDAEIAVDVLINFKAPQVQAKINNFLDEYDKSTEPANAPGGGAQPGGGNTLTPKNGAAGNNLYNPMAGPARNVFRLVEAYKSKDNLPILYKLATAPIRQRNLSHGTKEAWFWSNRTPPLAAMITLAGQKPEDYSLRQVNMMAHSAWAFSSEADENNALKKFREWYVANVDKNVPEITEQPPPAPLPHKHRAAPDPATSQPASQPVASQPAASQPANN